MKLRNRYPLLFAALLALLALSACRVVVAPPPATTDAAATPAQAQPTPDAATAALLETLGNLTYSGILETGPITLTAGAYTYTEEGLPTQPGVRLLDEPIAQGDLNGDGETDAVALLENATGGSARFTYLAPVLTIMTAPVSAPVTEIGGNVQVQSLAIENGQVVVEYIGLGEGDADCCPTWNLRGVYAWKDGELVEVSTDQVSKVTAAESSAADVLNALTDEEFGLFMAATTASNDTFMAALAICPQRVAPGGITFPSAEPNYNAKRPLNLDPFAAALADFSAERRAALDGLLAGKGVLEIQALMDDGQLSAVDLVTYYVDRIQRYDVNRLNSVIELNPDALDLAAALDAERTAGPVRGPLQGIPVLLKDNIATGDKQHTTAGAYALKDWQADRDAFLVQQLRDAGAIILGKANLSEWAGYVDPCEPNGFTVLGGQTRNPYGPYDTLGSSSGSAASVAANLATVSVGSETSGSLIQPSRYNGVAALRPSQGLISRDHVIPLSPDLDTPGPIGRWVTDVALLLNAMAGADSNDAKTADAAELDGVDFTQFLSVDEARKLRVGVIVPTQSAAASLQRKAAQIAEVTGKELTAEEQAKLLAEDVLPELGGDPQTAIDALKAAGIEVVLIEDSTLPPTPDTARPLLAHSFKTGIADFFGGLSTPAPIANLADLVAINKEDLANRAPFGQAFLEASANDATTPEDYAVVRTVAQALARNWMESVLATNNVDVLVSGTMYAGNAGAAGVPALTVPAGLDATGRPQGIILTGRYLSEPKLFAVAYALEQALHGRVEPDLDATIQQIDAITKP